MKWARASVPAQGCPPARDNAAALPLSSTAMPAQDYSVRPAVVFLSRWPPAVTAGFVAGFAALFPLLSIYYFFNSAIA